MAGVIREPAWVSHAIWWHVYPLGFTGADATGADRRLVHRLGQLGDWLDYAVRLGVSGIALGPVFESTSHGYDTIDYFRVDPRLGDEDDFDRLVALARERGLRILLDGVFNHVGREFPAFKEVLARGSSSAKADWFVHDQDGAGDGDGTGYASFEGHSGLVTLNHASPAVADHVVDVMTHWLGRGTDGWRLDAAYAVPPGFWAQVLPRVRASYPDAYLMGEWIHGDYAAAVVESTLDSVTQYELWKALWSSINDLNLFELGHALERHNGWLDTFVPFTFVGNHDVTRLASRLDSPRHLCHALAVLMTTGGTPSIYYGDEQAFTGVKEERVGGDDAVRPAFPARPEDLDPAGWSTYRSHQDLVGLRRRNPWLHRARTEIVSLTNEQLVYDATDGTKRVRVCLNLGDADLRVDVRGAEVLGGEATVDESAAIVGGHGWAVLQP